MITHEAELYVFGGSHGVIVLLERDCEITRHYYINHRNLTFLLTNMHDSVWLYLKSVFLASFNWFH